MDVLWAHMIRRPVLRHNRLNADLEKRITEAVLFHRLAVLSSHAQPLVAFEYVRAANDILARVWTDMEGSGEFPPVLVSRIEEIEHNLVAVMGSLAASPS